MMTVNKQRLKMTHLFNSTADNAIIQKNIRVVLKKGRASFFSKNSENIDLIKNFMESFDWNIPLHNRVFNVSLFFNKSNPSKFSMSIEGKIFQHFENAVYLGGVAAEGIETFISLRSRKPGFRQEAETINANFFSLSCLSDRTRYKQEQVFVPSCYLNSPGRGWRSNLFNFPFEITVKINVTDMLSQKQVDYAAHGHEELLRTAFIADVRLIANDRSDHLCHLHYIAAGSKFLAEKIKLLTRPGIQITSFGIGYSKDALQTLLVFLYSGDARRNLIKSPNLGIEVLELAQKFKVNRLMEFLIQFFLKRTSKWYSTESARRLNSNLVHMEEKTEEVLKLEVKLFQIVNGREKTLYALIDEQEFMSPN